MPANLPVLFSALLPLLLLLLCGGAQPVHGKQVSLSNVALPRDTGGHLLYTGEASALAHNGTYYLYFNNWGGCTGVDCCPTAKGCADCCYTKAPFADPCVYTNNHSVVVYRTADFATFEYAGEALPRARRADGIEFRPCVVYNARTRLFVMWYEDRHSGQEGYAVATSPTAEGPFATVSNSTKMAGKGRRDGAGDFNILVDDDGAAYHVRDGFVVVRLSDDYLSSTTEFGYLHTPKPSEGPVFFKRGGLYYILPGTGCCGCRGGASIYVFTATAPLGPYTFRGEIGSNQTAAAPLDAHSPYNYVTRAQASSIVAVPSSAAPGAEVQYLWLGNQWVTSTEPGRPRNHDLLYWTVLNFTANGSIAQVQRQDETVISVA